MLCCMLVLECVKETLTMNVTHRRKRRRDGYALLYPISLLLMAGLMAGMHHFDFAPKFPTLHAFPMETVTWTFGATLLGELGRSSAKMAHSSSDRFDGPNDKVPVGIRLNKVFTHQFSRRAADQLIQSGRVKVNGAVVADMGRRVVPYQDVVQLDDQIYTQWELHCNIIPNLPDVQLPSSNRKPLDDQPTVDSPHIYIKFWKPVGVISTTDRNVRNNLIDALYDVALRRCYDQRHQKILQHGGRRIFNVGRLDKDSSGLLLLTSDGRIPNVVLSKRYAHSKVYYVRIDRPISETHLQQLRDGIVITTDTIRQGKHRSFIARTLPCLVEPLYSSTMVSSSFLPTTELQITLTEGRNRQIRVMLQTVGEYTVLELHRLQFLSQIDLSNLHRPGDWTFLNVTEVQALQDAILDERAVASSNLMADE